MTTTEIEEKIRKAEADKQDWQEEMDAYPYYDDQHDFLAGKLKECELELTWLRQGLEKKKSMENGNDS